MTDMRKSIDSVSHGRGGAGNIGADPNPYVDGEIVRKGTPGDGPYSTGRGGAANIGSPETKAIPRHDVEYVPEAATRPSQEDAEFHTGRGGGGNVNRSEEEQKPKRHQGLADKLKYKLFRSRSKPKK